MARGWESKAVESQMEDRARVVDELALCGSDARRVALQGALAALDEELDQLSRAPRGPSL